MLHTALPTFPRLNFAQSSPGLICLTIKFLWFIFPLDAISSKKLIRPIQLSKFSLTRKLSSLTQNSSARRFPNQCYFNLTLPANFVRRANPQKIFIDFKKITGRSLFAKNAFRQKKRKNPLISGSLFFLKTNKNITRFYFLRIFFELV